MIRPLSHVYRKLHKSAFCHWEASTGQARNPPVAESRGMAVHAGHGYATLQKNVTLLPS